MPSRFVFAYPKCLQLPMTPRKRARSQSAPTGNHRRRNSTRQQLRQQLLLQLSCQTVRAVRSAKVRQRLLHQCHCGNNTSGTLFRPCMGPVRQRVQQSTGCLGAHSDGCSQMLCSRYHSEAYAGMRRLKQANLRECRYRHPVETWLWQRPYHRACRGAHRAVAPGRTRDGRSARTRRARDQTHFQSCPTRWRIT